MVDEENTPLEPLRGGESRFGGLWYGLQGWPKEVHLEEVDQMQRGGPQPINLEVAWDPNIITDPGWQDERGMWMYSTIKGRWSEHIWGGCSFQTHWMSKHKYGL